MVCAIFAAAEIGIYRKVRREENIPVMTVMMLVL